MHTVIITYNTSFRDKTFTQKDDNLFTKREGLAFSYRYSSFREHLFLLFFNSYI